MAYFAAKDATDTIIYIAATGSGTTLDPYVPTHTFTNALPAGSAVIGKLAANDGVDVGDVTINGPFGQALAASSIPVVLTAAQLATLTPPAALTGFATSAKQDTQITAEQAILAKLLAAPATEAKQDTGNTSLASIDTKTPALGQALAAASVPVILPLATITTLTPPAAITGFATETTLAALNTKAATAKTADYDSGAGTDTVQMIGVALPASGGAVAGGTSTNPLRTDPTGTTAQPITDNSGSLTVDNAGTFAVQAAQSGTWTVQPGNTANTTAWKVDGSAVTQPVSSTTLATAAKQPALGTAGSASTDVITVQGIASGTVLPTKETRSATPSQSSVVSSASSVSLLASNSSRLGATIYNDSTAILYLKLGATASTSSFSVAMAASSYYEVPFGYTGAIDGIWASANGNARITELT